MRLPCGGVRASAFLRPRTLISDNQVSRALNPYLHLNSHRDFLTVKFIFRSSIISRGFFSQVMLVTTSCLMSTHECRASGRTLRKTNLSSNHKFLSVISISLLFWTFYSMFFVLTYCTEITCNILRKIIPSTLCFIIHLNKMNDFFGNKLLRELNLLLSYIFLILRLSC